MKKTLLSFVAVASITVAMSGQKASAQEITVKKGDTLSGIASRYGVTTQYLYQKNKQVIGNNPDKIYPGQILTI